MLLKHGSINIMRDKGLNMNLVAVEGGNKPREKSVKRLSTI